MRTFVVVGHTQPTEPDFSLDDLAGGAGRLDVLCRCVNAAFLLSHDIREAVRLYLVIRDRVAIRLEGATLRHVAPDERNIAGHLRGALEAAGDAVGHQAVEAGPGIHASKRSLSGILDGVDGDVVRLHEDGAPVSAMTPPADPVFVLGDHRELTADEERLVAEHAAERVRLGPERLHADHAITVVHNYLDTAGYTRY